MKISRIEYNDIFRDIQVFSNNGGTYLLIGQDGVGFRGSGPYLYVGHYDLCALTALWEECYGQK